MASDGLIGRAADFLVDDTDWQVRYMLVDTGDWWPGEKILIAPQTIQTMQSDQRAIELSASRDRVKGAPRYRPDMTVDGDYDQKFLTYYGIKFAEK